MRLVSFSRFFISLLIGLAASSAALAQQNWQWVNPLPASIGWKSAAYGNGLYVVVGGDGLLVTSPDAITWTPRQATTDAANLNSVAFAGGRFVAVGSTNLPRLGAALILTSSDGITWTKNTTVATDILAQLSAVAFGNNTWVISGASSNRVLTSADGLTWTARNAGATTGKMVFANGVFVALTNNNRALTSADGIAWTTVTLNSATGAFFNDITFGGGKFAAAGRNGSNFVSAVATSTDGTTWTAGSDIPDSGGSSFIAFANNTFILGGNSELFSSADGVTWAKRTSAMPPTRSSSTNSLGTENIGALAGANNTLFAFGIYGSITTATDGATWTRRSSGTAHDINGLVWDGTRFVGVGTGGTVVTSPDGVAWTARSTNQTGWFGKLAYANGVYAAAGLNGLYTSTDLATWTNRGNTSFNQMWGVIHADGRFVAANSGISTGLLVSADGTTWTTVRITGANGNVSGLAWANGLYVLTTGGSAGTTARIYSSPDATNWTERTPAGFASPDSLAYANGRFLVLGGTSSWVSTDGITWTSPGPLVSAIRSVMSVNNRFVARNNGPGFATSDDGATWTTVENSSTANVLVAAMVVKDNKVIAAASGGGILRGDLIGAAAPTTLNATVASGASVQWLRNGSNVSGATSAALTLASVAPADAGIYSASVTAGGATTLQSFVVGVSSTAKVIGTGRELSANIPHPNTNIFDQILLEGAAATVTADAGQAIRLSYIDLQNDIVQVEFSGAGTLSIVLDGASAPAAPVNYNQPTVSYVKGHAGIVVTGANETTNLLIFSVGRATAFDPTGGYNILAAPSATNVPANNGSSLFQGKAGTTYDGLADIAFVAISSTNGKFGGLRTSNTSYWATKGPTGIYAPGVEFTGPVFAHDINAQETALPVFVIGSSFDTRITGGDLAQVNNAAVQVAGLAQLKFTAGITSHGTDLSAKTNLGRLVRDGADITAQIVVNP